MPFGAAARYRMQCWRSAAVYQRPSGRGGRWPVCEGKSGVRQANRANYKYRRCGVHDLYLYPVVVRDYVHFGGPYSLPRSVAGGIRQKKSRTIPPDVPKNARLSPVVCTILPWRTSGGWLWPGKVQGAIWRCCDSSRKNKDFIKAGKQILSSLRVFTKNLLGKLSFF